MQEKQIVMFGGAFNPPLYSHFSLAEQIINKYKQVEKVIFVPVNSKYKKADLISNKHRYEMLKLICDKNEKFEVSNIELESKTPLYTIETLEILKNQYPNNEIAFMIGSDNLKDLSNWYNAEKLVQNFKIYVLERKNDSIEEIIQSNQLLSKNNQSFYKVKNGDFKNLSSTYVRNNIKNGESIKNLTPDEIIMYIEKNKLYR